MLYDGDCGFCTSSARLAPRLGCRAEVVPCQRWPHLAEHGITEAAAGEALHAVSDDRVLVGHQAVAGVLGTSRYAPVRMAGAAIGSRLVSPLAARTYTWVAAHRGSLPGGTPACAVGAEAEPTVDSTVGSDEAAR